MRGVGRIVVGFVLLFGLATASLAGQDQPLPSGHADDELSVAGITIPPRFGYVIKTYPPATSTSPGIIVHVQEAHTNYEAQQHLMGILEGLIQEHGLKLILVEGGWGDVGLSYLRDFSPQDQRKRVADTYLKAGLMNAEEYLDLVSEYPLVLWGVEQKDLYQHNVEAFLEAERLQASLEPVVTSIREAVELLKPRLADPALNDLEAHATAFQHDKLALADYVDYLAGVAGEQGITEEGYPNLARFLFIRRLERTINRDAVQREQQGLLERLKGRASEQDFTDLMDKAYQMKAGTLARETFYASLEDRVANAGITLTQYPNVDRYVRFIKRSAQIKPTELSEELDRLITHLRMTLASTPQSRALWTALDHLDLIEKLLALRLSPQEYHQVQSVNLPAALSADVAFLNEQLTQEGLGSRAFAGLQDLTAALQVLARFYEVANQRDDAMVKQTVAKLQDTHERLAVLITGGFHSPQITQRLTEQGFGVVVVAPKVSTDTDEQLYHAVLRYKTGHGGSAADIMKLTNQPAPKTTVR